jgi:hypothetical protein
MNHDERHRITAVRKGIEAEHHQFVSDLTAEFEERAAAVRRERVAHRRRFIAGCLLAAGLGLAGTVLVATTSPTPRTHGGPVVVPARLTASNPSAPAASPASPRTLAPTLQDVDRRAVFRAIVLAEDRSEIETRRITPHSGRLTARERLERAKRHHAKFEQLAELRRRQVDEELAARYQVTREQIADIEREGKLRDWEYEIPAAGEVRKPASRSRMALARGPARPAARPEPAQAP